VAFPPADDPTRNASDFGKRGHIPGHDRPSTYDAVVTDGHSRQQNRVDPDVGPAPDPHRGDLEIRLDHRKIDWQTGVQRTKDFCPRPPADVLAEFQIASIEVALRSDPGPVADSAAAVEAALNDGLLADQHTITDFERFWVPDANVDPYGDAVTEPSGKRPQAGAAHHRIDVTLATGKAAVELEQLIAPAPGA
jgi:hypothetical protein